MSNPPLPLQRDRPRLVDDQLRLEQPLEDAAVECRARPRSRSAHSGRSASPRLAIAAAAAPALPSTEATANWAEPANVVADITSGAAQPIPAARARRRTRPRTPTPPPRSARSPGLLPDIGLSRDCGAVTPRAIRSRDIAPQSANSTMPEPTISQSVVVYVPVRSRAAPRSEGRDRADRVADAEHQPGNGAHLGGTPADVHGQRHHEREHRSRAEADQRRPDPGSARHQREAGAAERESRR